MTAYVGLLRAVNVGGTGKLPMAELKAMCEAAGFTSVTTYIASGNLIFESAKSEKAVKTALEKALADYAGKPGNKVVALFLDAAGSLDGLKHQTVEEAKPGRREIYVYYPDGQGRSKLVIPAAKNGTGRNMNTVAKLAEMAAAL